MRKLMVCIRIQIGSGFNDFVDPDLESGSGSGSRAKKKENEEKKALCNFLHFFLPEWQQIQ
jgi:hypothetical protein